MFLSLRHRALLLACILVWVGGASSEPSDPVDFTTLEKEVFRETNLLRTNPNYFAELLQKRLVYYDGLNYQTPEMNYILRTKEGKKAVLEAITACKNQQPVSKLSLSEGMTKGARDHVRDTGQLGMLGHTGSDGSSPFERINRHGKWQKTAAENISYGIGDSGREVVIQLLVDDGVSNRGHRKNLFHPDFHVTGVACGPHKTYQVMCTITYAGGYLENVREVGRP